MRKLADDCEAGLIDEAKFGQSLQSYLGVLSHADAYQLREALLNEFWF